MEYSKRISAGRLKKHIARSERKAGDALEPCSGARVMRRKLLVDDQVARCRRANVRVRVKSAPPCGRSGASYEHVTRAVVKASFRLQVYGRLNVPAATGCV